MGKIDVEKQDSVKMYKIRKTLDELTDKSGHGTELITVYIPKGKQLHEIINTLREEQGTADNIKSDLTRGHVVDSLGKVIQRLKLYLYRCDDHFHVDILKDMLKDDNLIGFIAIDAKDCGWGLLHGDKIEVLAQTGSGVAGKHRQGGQSAKRFQKLREMELTYYYNRIAETSREYFIDIYPVKGLIVSGPGPTKEEFINGNYLEYRLQNMIISTIDSSYAGAEGIREAFAKSGDILSNFRMVEEKKLVEDLFRHINSHSGLGSYGLQEIIEYLQNNVVDTLIITDDTNLHRVEGKCKRCQHIQAEIIERQEVIPKKTQYTNNPCPSCKAMEVEVSERDIVDYLALIAAKTGTKIEVISGSAEYGNMLSSLGKVGAILRYNPGHSK
jgi:peptide chain release factor subunit 1